MAKLALSSLLFLTLAYAYPQTGHNIKLTLKPYRNTQVYLGYHFGKLKAVSDSIVLDAAGTGTFKGKDKLPGGIYFIVSPKKEILFELLVDRDQDFSIVADTSNIAS